MNRLRQLMHIRGLAALALFIVLGQSALLWHQHDAAAHEQNGHCEVCVHSHATSGPASHIAPAAIPAYRVEDRLACDRVSAQSHQRFRAFRSRAPPVALSI